ncbi:hypothetical protein CC78DRAFT_179555 [Lojkania enalia]|uniref:Developmental regulator n=1 Tax=Lojkania enalia TaxID=147567 RepID=A0A9P4MX23_9PLEO|nr:hypothetical protein CC78DRAFT_179555 [Didymosphaeria enalia]
MPTWLVHGFRWPRPLIRIHIILQNLDDCAPEWLMAPATASELMDNFNQLYPDIMPKLPSLRFIEQYDPEDLISKDHPYAYVCDQVHEIQLSVDVDELRGKGVANDAWDALVDLRDKLAPGEKVGWFVVVNGDVERWHPPAEGSSTASEVTPTSAHSNFARGEELETVSDEGKRQAKGFKKWFSGSKARRSKSSKDLRSDIAIRTAASPVSPPLPPLPTALAPEPTNGKAPVCGESAT